jgi:hypothetical protein
VIELWIAYQTELHAHGVNAHARRLDWQIWQAMVMVPGIDADPGEELHLLAYPARPRPPRLVRGDVSQ